MLGIPHLCFLFLTLIFVIYVNEYVKSKNYDFIIKFLRIITLITLTLDPIYWLWEYNKLGRFNFATTLPLYICSLFWILMPFSTFRRKDFVQEVCTACICTVCMIGGVMGLILNTHINVHGFFSFVALRSLFYHVLMIVAASVMWTSGFLQTQGFS